MHIESTYCKLFHIKAVHNNCYIFRSVYLAIITIADFPTTHNEIWTIFNVLAGLSLNGLNLFELQFRRDSIRPCLFNYSSYGRLIHHDAAQTSE